MKQKKFKILLAIFLIIGATTLRLVPHIPNFAPIAAIALFSGFYLKNRLTWLVPIAAMLASDTVIGFYQWPVMLSVYLSFILIALLGNHYQNKRNFSTVYGSSLLGSVSFFIITNLAVWAFSGMYILNYSGLVNCFYLALPFFRNTLFGDLFYVSLIFGLWEAATYLAKEKQPKYRQEIQ